jgi:hypothetical protein
MGRTTLRLGSYRTSVVVGTEKIRNALCAGSCVLELSDRVNKPTVTQRGVFQYVGLEVGIYAADRMGRTSSLFVAIGNSGGVVIGDMVIR